MAKIGLEITGRTEQLQQQRLIMTPKIPKNINPEELLKKALKIANKSKII